jgi:hypothetical protein
MGQFRFHNYQRPLNSFDENLRIMGLAHGSVYSGFDEMSVVAGNTLAWAHTHSALKHTQQNGAAGANRSVIVSQQGTIVMEDASIQLNVDFNVGNAHYRKDFLIMTHSYLDSVGGSNAVYSIIKGPLGGYADPTLTNPLVQVKIGELIILPNAADHTLTSWERTETKTLGGIGVFSKFSESEVMTKTGEYFKNISNYDKSGFYYVSNNPSNAPVVAGQTDWFLIVSRRGNKINQIAQAAGNGKVFTRAAVAGVWTSWINLNNPDVEANVTALSNSIGNKLYAENNYILDSETITASLNKLDIALKDVSDLVTIAETDINNAEANIADLLSDVADLQNYVGTLLFDYQRVVVNSDDLTDNLDRLDATLRQINGAHNLNDAAFKVGMFLVTALPVNGPSGFFKDPGYPCYMIANYDSVAGTIHQTFIVSGGLARPLFYTRDYTGVAWTGWGLRNYLEVTSNLSIAKKRVDISNWDMDAVGTKTVAHGLINHTRILSISVMIFDDSGNIYDFLHHPTQGASDFRPSGFITTIDATNISLFRQPSADNGWFDNTSFDFNSSNRGYITIEYWVP